MPNIKNHQSTFKSYVDLPVNGIGHGGEKRRELRYLPGETQISKCDHVLRYVPFFDKTQAIIGTLHVTNFKIAFIPQQTLPLSDTKQRNKLIREEDIVLNSVSSIYQVSKGKRRKILPSNGTSAHFVKTVEIHCKDFRVHTFCFKKSPKDEAKKIANSMIHHSFPIRLDLLFAFDCQLGDFLRQADQGAAAQPTDVTEHVVRRFNTEKDWLEELQRLKVHGFRALECNAGFQNYESLPEVLVVPKALDLPEMKKFSTYFTGDRLPLWSYSCANGASLVRMASAIPDQSACENRIIDKIKLAHPNEVAPIVYDISQSPKAPSMRDIQASHEKLKELCMPVTLKDATSKDNNWLSQLEGTNWLQNVSKCLSLSLEVVNNMLEDGKTVIIKEPHSRDVTPLITSLVQLMLDAQYRTQIGFQELIEREWVALGHDFTSRLGLLLDLEPCPIFLLFLDCVWQLHQQFPSAFQFSEIYLTALWDTLCLGLFDNFMFDSIRKRQYSVSGGSYGNPNLAFMSAWNWSLQYDKEDQSLFNNPLYKARTVLGLKLPRSHKSGRKGSSLRRVYSMKLSSIHDVIPSQDVHVLRPVVKQPMLKLWKHNYLRWITPIQIQGGGSPSEYIQQCLLVEEILLLQHKLDSLRNDRAFVKSARPNSNLLFSSSQSARVQYEGEGNQTNLTSDLALTSSFPYTPQGARGPECPVDTLVSAFLENSFIQESDDDKESVDGLSINENLES